MIQVREIRSRRTELNLTQQRLADLSGLSVQCVRMLENDKHPGGPMLRTVERIEGALREEAARQVSVGRAALARLDGDDGCADVLNSEEGLNHEGTKGAKCGDCDRAAGREKTRRAA